MGTCGIAAGALEVLRIFQEHIPQKKLKEIIITPAGCIGLCAHEPIVEISLRGTKIAYGHVDTQAARRIVDEHIVGGKVVEDLQIDTELFPTI
jgi:NADP-reducing hydrogenase subunit HndB